MRLKLRRNSIANQVLIRLSDTPTGQLHVSAFFDLLKGNNSTSLETRLVNLCSCMIAGQLVTVEAEMWRITSRGRLQLESKIPKERYVGQIAATRQTPPFKALQITTLSPPYRSGSNDHLLIPSLLGSTRRLPCSDRIS